MDITTNFPLTIYPRISYIHYYTLVVSLTARMPDLQTSHRLSLISTLSGDLDSGGTGPKQEIMDESKKYREGHFYRAFSIEMCVTV